jgi:hypothetical protein
MVNKTKPAPVAANAADTQIELDRLREVIDISICT